MKASVKSTAADRLTRLVTRLPACLLATYSQKNFVTFLFFFSFSLRAKGKKRQS